MSEEVKYRIAYDVSLKRPGCVLLQAAMRCVTPDFQQMFPLETWLVSPTPDLRVYLATAAELQRLSEITRNTERSSVRR